MCVFFFFSSRRRHTRFDCDWSSDVCSSDLTLGVIASMQPYHAIDDGRWVERRIGPVRIKTTYAFRTLLDTGAKLAFGSDRSEEHTSELQSQSNLVCRLLLEKKKKTTTQGCQ